MLLQQQNTPSTSKNSSIIAHLPNFSLKNQWILDSGTMDHITRNNELLENYVIRDTNQFVTVANGKK
jgi:hypothetical protein